MTIPFSRTLRSMHIDSFRASLIGLILALLVVVALIGWFFLAKVTIFEYSTEVALTEDGRIMVTFPQEAMPRIRSGQDGLLHLDFEQEDGRVTLPVMVVNKFREENKAEILVMDRDLPSGLSSDEFTPQVQIEVESISPINLLMRASGRYLSGNERVPGSSGQSNSPEQ